MRKHAHSASPNEVRADTERADTGPSFREWMRQVNIEVLRISGVTTADIGDAAYRDNFGAGVSPHEMAIEALEQSDFPFEEA